jgi:hypothetical protein
VALIKAEPKQLIYFALFKVLLAIVGAIVQQIATIVAELIVLIPYGLICFVGWILLHSFGEVGKVLMTAGSVVLDLALIVAIFYFLILIQGCILTFFQAYGLYFLGGRYPLLGSMLEPPPPPELAPLPLLPDLPPAMPLESGAL